MVKATYEQFLELCQYRRSIRKLKPDSLPEGTAEKILECARLSMSGANSQSWEFIVVKNPETRRKVVEAYEKRRGLTASMEKMRVAKYRHPAFSFPDEGYDQKVRAVSSGWRDAPLLIIPLYDPRKQWGTVLAGHGEISWAQPQGVIGACTHGHMNMLIHLAAASLGLGSQRVDINCQSPFREILGYPEPLTAGPIIPVGYRAYEPGPCTLNRWPLEKLVHYDRYNMNLYLKDEDFLEYILEIRQMSRSGYTIATGEK